MSRQIRLKDGTAINVSRCGDIVSLDVREDKGGMLHDYQLSTVSIHMTQREATMLCEALLGITIEDLAPMCLQGDLAHH